MKKKKKSADRAKRRSESQRIGQEEELVFQRWAVQNRLNPHKADLDIGIDYFCEQMKLVATRAQEITGAVLVAQVRGTARVTRPHIRLERTDVVNALRMQAPYCLFAVSVKTSEIWFRFLDMTLFSEFTAFLKTSKTYLVHHVEHMQKGSADFSAGLKHISRPAFRTALEQEKAQARLESILPDAVFHVQGGGTGYTLVKVPALLSIFHLDCDRDREQAMEIFFTPRTLDATLKSAVRNFPLHEPFREIQDLALGPMIIVGEGERSVKLCVEYQGKRIESEFLLRRVHDERAYIGSSGLILRIGDARKADDGKHYHVLNSSLQSEGALDLANSGQLPFLKLLRAGALVNEVGRNGIAIEHFQLQELGAAVEAIDTVFAALNIPLTDAYLADLTAREFGRKIGFLEAILCPTATTPMIPSFVIGVPESHAIDATHWRACTYRVPIVLNLAGRGIVAWIYGNAEGYLFESLIHGFRFQTAVLEKTETLATEHSKVTDIQAWVCKDWPGLPLADSEALERTAENAGLLPFAGQFSIVHEPADTDIPCVHE